QLFDDQLRVHAYVNSPGIQLGRSPQPRDQPAVFRVVVGCLPQRYRLFGEHRPGTRVLHNRTTPRESRVTARATVGLDDHLAAHSPDSAVRTGIASQFSQYTTSSAAADLIWANVLRSTSSWQLPQRRARSMAAPVPFRLLIRSYSASNSA